MVDLNSTAKHRPADLNRRQFSNDELRGRAARLIPGGVNSNVRLDTPNVFFARGSGARIWDADGKEYIDYLLGQGPAFLGHAHPKVVASVAEACQSGITFAAQNPLEVEAAERICQILKWPDMVRLGMTGTESVQAAVRLARAVTGRRRIIRFEGQYHGWLDDVLIKFVPGPAQPASAGQLAEALAPTIVVPWNDLDALRQALERDSEDVAAVITEPMMLNQGAIEPRPGYLAGMKALCAEFGALLLFDEVITGFRLALGGAAERYGVAPDLAIYGKALAGGFPVSAIAGKREHMQRFGTGEVNHSGTFNGSVMGAAAVVASLDLLSADPPYERATAFGRALMAGMTEVAAETGLPLRLSGPGIAFHASFDPDLGNAAAVPDCHDLRDLLRLDAGRYRRLAHLLVEAGIWVAGRGIWYISAAHGDLELEDTLDRFRSALRMLTDAEATRDASA